MLNEHFVTSHKIGDPGYGADSLGHPGGDGVTFYCDYTSGLDTNSGYDAKAAKKTLQAAIDLCVNQRGDRIVVMRGIEAVSTTINLNKEGVTIISADYGMATQYGRWAAGFQASSLGDNPLIDITKPSRIVGCAWTGEDTTDDGYDVGAAIVCSGDDVATSGDFVHIIGNHIRGTLASESGIFLHGSEGCIIEYNLLVGDDSTSPGNKGQTGIALRSGSTTQVKKNIIRYNWIVDWVNGIRFYSGDPLLMSIHGNVFYSNTTNAIHTNNGAGFALVSGNYFDMATAGAAYDCAVNAGTWMFSGNHYPESA